MSKPRRNTKGRAAADRAAGAPAGTGRPTAGPRRRARGRAADRAACGGSASRRDWPAMPADADALHAWIARELGVNVPRSALIPGHDAPFDYLVHVMFEGEGSTRCPHARTASRGGGPDGACAGGESAAGAASAGSAGGAAAAAASGARDCIVWANRGGGKTFLGAVATVLDLVFKPEIEVRILGGSLEQSKRMHGHLRRLLERPGLAWMVSGRLTERRVRLRNGSSAEVLAQSHTSVRGTRVQRLRCDEVELFDPEVWEAAQLATRSKDCGGILVRGSVECLSTMHLPHGLMFRLVRESRGGESGSPPDGEAAAVGGARRRRVFRWGVVDVLGACGDEHLCERPGADGTSARCALWDECRGRAKTRGEGSAGHVSVADALAMKARVSQATWQTEMLCRRPRRTDAVLPEFSAATHVVADVPEHRAGWRWVGGMDFGFRAPAVVLWGAADPEGVLRIVDERVVAEATLGEHVRAIMEAPWPRLEWIGVDPAGSARNEQTGSSAIGVLKAAGLSVKQRRLALADGLGLVRARLRPASGPPRLFVHARCARLIESLERYHYAPDGREPEKDGHDHAVDALRYLVQNLDRPHRTVRGCYV